VERPRPQRRTPPPACIACCRAAGSGNAGRRPPPAGRSRRRGTAAREATGGPGEPSHDGLLSLVTIALRPTQDWYQSRLTPAPWRSGMVRFCWPAEPAAAGRHSVRRGRRTYRPGRRTSLRGHPRRRAVSRSRSPWPLTWTARGLAGSGREPRPLHPPSTAHARAGMPTMKPCPRQSRLAVGGSHAAYQDAKARGRQRCGQAMDPYGLGLSLGLDHDAAPAVALGNLHNRQPPSGVCRAHLGPQRQGYSVQPERYVLSSVEHPSRIGRQDGGCEQHHQRYESLRAFHRCWHFGVPVAATDTQDARSLATIPAPATAVRASGVSPGQRACHTPCRRPA
jgi:hypothetical protein